MAETASSWRRRDILLYQQVDALLRDLIARGALRPGDRLPTEAELSDQYGVSRATIRQALDVLDRDGLIERAPGRGTFLRIAPATRQGIVRPRIDGASLPAQAARRAGTLLAHGNAPAPDVVTGAFGLPADSATPFVITILTEGSEPRAALKRYLRPDLELILDPALRARPDLPQAIADLRGEARACGEIWAEAILAEPRFAMMLKVPLGSPLLSLWWVETIGNKPAICSQMLQPAGEIAIGIVGETPSSRTMNKRRNPPARPAARASETAHLDREITP